MDVDTDQATADARALARSLRTLVSVLWDNLSQEGRSVFHDFASFMRLALADAADHVGASAQQAAETLREVNKEVQEGQRNELGVKRKAEGEPQDADARAKFERAMDSTKQVGSDAIGAGQVAVATGEDLANRTSSRLQDAIYKVCDLNPSSLYHASCILSPAGCRHMDIDVLFSRSVTERRVTKHIIAPFPPSSALPRSGSIAHSTLPVMLTKSPRSTHSSTTLPPRSTSSPPYVGCGSL